MTVPPRKAFPLRLDPVLHAAIERTAACDLRSVNAQVECLLREALARRGVKLEPPARARRGRPREDEKRGRPREDEVKEDDGAQG